MKTKQYAFLVSLSVLSLCSLFVTSAEARPDNDKSQRQSNRSEVRPSNSEAEPDETDAAPEAEPEGTASSSEHSTREFSLPPGLQRQLDRNGTLPPGLQRQLDRNGSLPPGLQRSQPASSSH